jgi:protein O-GlcNAc transferase
MSDIQIPTYMRGRPVLLILLALLLAVAPAEARKRGKKDAPPPPEQNPEVFFQEGLLHYNEGQLDRALQRFEKATQLAPDYHEAFYMLGMTYLNLSDLNRAEKALRASLEINPFFTDAHNLLGMIYDQKGELDRAVVEWNIVLSDQNFPQPWNATFNIGRAMARRGNWEEAQAQFLRTVGLKSDWFRAWYHLGLAREEMNNLQQAAEAYEAALKYIDDGNPALHKIHFRLALTSYKQGFNVKALEHFKKVYEIRPDTEEGRKSMEFIGSIEGGDPGNRGMPSSLYR